MFFQQFCIQHYQGQTIEPVAFQSDSVFRIGNNKVVKIVGEKEAKNTETIRQIRQSAPEQFLRHLPVIHQVYPINGTKRFVIEMESLLEIAEEKKCNRLAVQPMRTVKDFLNNDDFMEAFLIYQSSDGELPGAALPYVKQVLIDFVPKFINSSFDQQVRRTAFERLSSLLWLRKTNVQITEEKWSRILTNILQFKEIPVNHCDFQFGSHPVFETLKWLKTKGIFWIDVHEDNVMEREDGTPVLIDFEFWQSKVEKMCL